VGRFRGDTLHYLGSNAFDVVASMGNPLHCDQVGVLNAQICLSYALTIRPRECLTRSPSVDKRIEGKPCNV
jgi:hypothetical protein